MNQLPDMSEISCQNIYLLLSFCTNDMHKFSFSKGYEIFENTRGFLMFSHEGLAGHGCIEYNGEWIEAAEKTWNTFSNLRK